MSEGERIQLLAAALIVDDQGRVLLTRHAPHWKWHLPDGDSQFGLTLSASLRKALHGDLDVDIRIQTHQPAVIAEVLNPSANRHFVILCYPAVITSGTPTERPGTLEHGWFSEDMKDALRGNMYESSAHLLRKALGWKL